MTGLVHLALLMLVTGSLVNGEIWNEPPRKFSSGEEYLFHYDGQILTGIPTSSWHYSGYRFSAHAVLKMVGKNQFFMRLQSIRFLQLNDEINVDIPTVFLSEDHFRETYDKDIFHMFQQHLQRPIRFMWTDGLVNKLEVDKSDMEWSINLKKGILNMLNIDLSTRKDEDRIEWNGAYRHSRYEEGIEGRCRSVYHWNHLPIATLRGENDQESAPLTMVKTRDLNDCIDTMAFEHRNFLRKDCAQKTFNVSTCLLGADSTVRANVTYWQQTKEFFFWGIETNARYTFSLTNPKLGSFSTFVKQNLTFINDFNKGRRDNKSQRLVMVEQNTVGDDREDEESVAFVEVSSLRMNMTFSELPWTQGNMETQHNLVTKLFTLIQKQLSEKTPDMLKTTKRLISMLRKAPKSLLLRLHRECVQLLLKQPELLHWFYDLLPAIGTKEALDVFIETTILSPVQIKAGELFVTDSEIARRITAFSLIEPVKDQNMIAVLMKLASSSTLQRDRKRRETLKSSILAIATLCNSYRDKAFMKQDSALNAKSSVLIFFKKLLTANVPILSKEEKLIVIVKALGNCGIRTSLPILRKLLFSKDSSLAVQVQCVYSFKKLASFVPEEVRKMTLPIFFDVTKDTELRIASYLISMRTRPKRVLLNSIIEFTLREPVKQVKSFVISHLKDLSSSPCTCGCEIVRNVSQILQTVQLGDTGIQYSHTHRLALTESLAAVVRSGIIFAPDDFLPRSSNFRIFADFEGQETPVLEAGFRAKDMQKLLKKLIGPNGKLLSDFDLRSLLKSLENSEGSLDENFSLYMKLFDEEVGLWLLNEEISETLQKGFIPFTGNMMDFMKGKTLLPFNFRRNSFTEETVRVPTVFGLPFITKVSFILHAQINGTVKMKGGSGNEELISGQMKLKPFILSQFIAQSGVDATIGRANVQVKLDAHLPFNKELVINARYTTSDGGKLQIQMERPQEEWNLFQMNCSMTSVMMQTKPNSEWFVNITRMPMKYEKLQSFSSSKEYNKESFVLDLEPLGLQVNAAMRFPPSVAFMNSAHFPFKGPFSVNVSLKNVDKHPDTLELYFVSTNNNSKEGRSMGNGIRIQLLRAPSILHSNANKQAERNRKYMKFFSLENNPLYLDSFDQQVSLNEDKGLLVDLSVYTHSIDSTETRITSTLKVFKNLEGSSQINLTLKSVIQMPRRAARFEMSNPLQVEGSKRRENAIVFNSQLFVDDEDILKYQILYTMDPDTRNLFRRMIENPNEFQTFHPLTKQCVEDMKRQLNNSLACYNAWTYMNVLNRMDHKLVVLKTAPSFVKNIISYLINNKLWLIRNVVEDFDILEESDVDEFFKNVNPSDWVYAASLITSPIHPHHISVDYLFGKVMLHVPSMNLPKLYVTSMFPMEKNLYSSVLRYATQRLYPATCYLHNSRERATHLQTFDGFQYNLHNVSNFFQSKQIILTQDMDQTFQVSLLWTSEERGVQIMNRNMTGLIKVIGRLPKGINQVFIDSQPIRQMPLTLKSKKGEIVVQIQSLEEYMIGEGSVMQISLPLLGVDIKTDLVTFVHIQVSPFFHTSLRGLCGDFDGENRQEMKTPDCKRFFLHPEDVIYSPEYVRPLNGKTTSQWVTLKSCQSDHLLMPEVLNPEKMKKRML